ncbi:MAG: hypothetical protein RIS36_613 [Pseudomonadota bacterium]|jgi:hypothetical protein
MRYIPLLIAVAIFVLDLIERLTGFRTPLTFYLWVGGIGVVIASVLYSLVRFVTSRSFWTLKDLLGSIAVVVLLGALLWPQLSEFYAPITMHPESTRQASCGIDKLNAVNGSVEAAYSWCFLGYNTRQYIPQALLFNWFGPSTFALNAPYVFFLVLGFIAYVAGLKTAIDRGYGGYLLLMTAIVLPLQSYYYFFLAYAYEQSVFPFGLTLLALGALLQCAFQFRAWNIGISLLSLQYLLFSYTPAVSVYFFAGGILALLALGTLPTARARYGTFVAIVACTAIHFWISLAHRADIRLFKESQYSASTIDSTLTPLFRAIFYTGLGTDWAHSSAYSMAFATLGLLLLLFLTNTRLRILGLCAFGWSIAHIVLAAYSKGYAAPPIPFALHRALPMLPVLGLVIFFGFGALRGKRPNALFPIVCVVLLGLHLTLGFYQSRAYASDLHNRRFYTFPHAEVLDQIYTQLSNKEIDYLTLGAFFVSTPHTQTFPDFASFYFPKADHTRSATPVIPNRPEPTAPFIGLYVGGADETEPFVSGTRPLPDGMVLGQVIRVPKMRNGPQGIIAYTYQRKPSQEVAAAK